MRRCLGRCRWDRSAVTSLDKTCSNLVVRRAKASSSKLPRPRALPRPSPALDHEPPLATSVDLSASALAVPRPSSSSRIEASYRLRSDFGKEIRGNMDRFPEAMLLTQVGKFYESYFEQAKQLADICNLTLTRKSWTLDDGRSVDLDFCGFPLSTLSKHLGSLVDSLGRVIIVNEIGDKEGGGKNRSVVRIATPATLFDDGHFDPGEPAYLLAIASEGVGFQDLDLAWIDSNTGEAFGQQGRLSDLMDDLLRIAPAELVVRSCEPQLEHFRTLAQRIGISFGTLAAPEGTEAPEGPSRALDLARRHLAAAWPSAFGRLDYAVEERGAALRLDANAFAALELRNTAARGGSRTGSLVQNIKRTVTPGGSRLLLRRISEPSADLSVIRSRHDMVEAFVLAGELCDALAPALRRAGDGRQFLEKLKHGQTQHYTSALRAVASLLHGVTDIKKSLQASLALSRTVDSLQTCPQLLRALDDVTAEATPMDARQAEDDSSELASSAEEAEWPTHIRPSAAPDLATAHASMSTLMAARAELERSVQTRLGRQARLSVSLQNQPYLSVPAHAVQALNRADTMASRTSDQLAHSRHYRLIRTLRSRSHFHFEPWTSLYGDIHAQREFIRELENAHLASLRDKVMACEAELRHNAAVLDELDVARGFSLLARDRHYVRPVMDDSTALVIHQGRHPSVSEALLKQGRDFVPNGIDYDGSVRSMRIVTGPNMGGKSTFLRQIALIVVLAQAGSFVPAESARIGLCDGIYTRIGAHDDLYGGQSTFMVEMLETASILRHATDRSLVIMDEVGRGTAPEEGLAISYGVIDHLLRVNRSRTLFATHFHDLVDVLAADDAHRACIGYLCTDATEHDNGDWTFSHAVRDGVNRHAGALQVARYAELPESAILAAQDLARRRAGVVHHGQ